jgi:hypothetical protein
MADSCEPQTPRQLCTSCNAPMKLVRIVPRLGGMLELHTFECKQCGLILTKPATEDN